MNQITIEYCQNTLGTLINRAVVEGVLTIEAVRCLDFLLNEAREKSNSKA